MAYFFPYHRVWQTSRNIFLSVRECSGGKCASFNIIFVTPNYLMKKWWFEKKATFPVEIFFNLCFLILSRMIVISLQLQRGHKIYWNLLCKSKKRFSKTNEFKGRFLKGNHLPGGKKRFWPTFPVITCDAVENTIVWKRAILAFFLVLCSIENLSEVFITVHIVFWHFLCNI